MPLVGKPLLPDTRTQLIPPSMLRKSPPVMPTKTVFAEASSVAPRAAIPEIFLLITSGCLICAQLSPPSVVRNIPARGPPFRPKLLNRPIPATSVWWFTSVGSNSNAPIESDGKLSVNGFQLGLAAVALLVLQIPPLTAPA